MILKIKSAIKYEIRIAAEEESAQSANRFNEMERQGDIQEDHC